VSEGRTDDRDRVAHRRTHPKHLRVAVGQQEPAEILDRPGHPLDESVAGLDLLPQVRGVELAVRLRILDIGEAEYARLDREQARCVLSEPGLQARAE
jgi:hypothetical protein